MEAQFDFLTREFLKDSTRNYFKKEDGKLYVSKIFDWYGGYFKKNKRWGSLEGFLAEHMELSPEVKEQLKAGKVAVKFLDYDWNLNISK
jgi:hypothetical protein